MLTIVITNFNYGAFLAEAVESALHQTSEDVDVVVVDDGSSDNSRALLERYRTDVRLVYKETGGQASAINAGFEACRGDVVIFLDADDVLLSDTAARVLDRFRRQPDLAKVHYRLRLIDVDGEPTGKVAPARGVQLSEGDLRARVLRSPNDVVHAPGASGNAYAAWALRRVLPLPEGASTGADVYLLNLVSLLGPVGVVDGVGGCYRIHGQNFFHSETLRTDRVRDVLRTTAGMERALAELACSLGLIATPTDVRFASVTNLAQRLISLRLEPKQHPFAADRVPRLAGCGIAATIRRRDLPVFQTALYVSWFAAMSIAPRRVVFWLADRLLQAWHEGALVLDRVGNQQD